MSICFVREKLEMQITKKDFMLLSYEKSFENSLSFTKVVILSLKLDTVPACIYQSKVNNRNNRKKCEVCSM